MNYIKKNRATITLCLIVVGFIAIIWVIIQQARHKAFEPFESSGMCPAGTTWFVDMVGNAGCCNGTINPTTRRCSGALACSFAARDALPQGVESCSIVMERENGQIVAGVCPPSLPYIIGSVNAPKGCCGVSTSGDNTCPVVAPQCSMFNGETTDSLWNGPAIKGQKMGCIEQRFHETLSCPTGFVLNGPTWQPEFSRNVSMCTNIRNMKTCYPKEQFDALVSAGNLRAADAEQLRCT